MNIEIKNRIDKIQNGIVPEGYKKSKVGIISEDWKVKKLGDLVDGFETGVSVNSDDESIKPNTKDIGILKTSSISNGKFNPLENKKVLEKEIKNVKVNPKENMIIISRMNTPELVGQVAYIEGDCKNLFLPDRLWQSIILDDSLIDTYWLTNTLISDRYRYEIKSIATGTSGSMKNISQNNFLNLILLTPPLPEQQKIADILSIWDKTIELKEKLIKEKEEQKKGLMQNLLTGEVRLPGFDDEWEETELKDISKIVTGTTPKTSIDKYYGGEYPWITPTDISKLKYIKESERTLTVEGLEKGRFIPKGSLLVTCIASIGKNAILIKDGSCNQQINAIYPSEIHSNEFLYYLISHSNDYLLSYASTTATSMINKTTFGKIVFNLPPLKEQKAIAEILSTSDKEIELLKELVKELKEQKKGLMQLLLTGIVRV